MLAGGFFAQIGRQFAPLAKAAGAFAKGERETEFDCAPPKLPRGGRARADALVVRIERGPHGHGLARRLADFVLERQDEDVWAMRPLKLARLWGVPDRHAIGGVSLSKPRYHIGYLDLRDCFRWCISTLLAHSLEPRSAPRKHTAIGLVITPAHACAPLSSNPPGAYVFGDVAERSKTLYPGP